MFRIVHVRWSYAGRYRMRALYDRVSSIRLPDDVCKWIDDSGDWTFREE